MEMRFLWVGDKVAQEMYDITWHPRMENLADYQSKHHTGAHHTSSCTNVVVQVYILVNIGHVSLILISNVCEILLAILLQATVLPETSYSWRESS
jgi:hypothetical protein